MNADLKKFKLPEWIKVPVCKQSADALNEWLPMALDQDMQELVDNLGGVAASQNMLEVPLNYEGINSELGTSWQSRIRAAEEPIEHYMGSFGPEAYSLCSILTLLTGH